MRFPKQTYTVYYRVGNTPNNFKWICQTKRHDAASASVEVLSLENEGYTAYLAPTHLLNAIGLPETFDCSDSLAEI